MSVAVEEHKLNLVLDVKVQLTVRLGSCELPMREMLELGPGAVIQLNQRANDPVVFMLTKSSSLAAKSSSSKKISGSKSPSSSEISQ